ncbi:MAG: hypothetical protein SCM11_11515 [Bacillota bacterium]|nr:hypothetical protein [Bacillota bacterium]
MSMKRVSVFILVFCLVAAITGCTTDQTSGNTTTTAGQTTTTAGQTTTTTSGATTEPTDDSGLPIVEDSITLTYWVGFGGWEATTMNSNAEKGCYIEKEKLTNIKIEWLHPSAGQEQTQFNLLFTSNDMPDMIEGYSKTYPGGPDKAVDDGYYLKLNDLIEEHAPNYKKLRDMSPDIAKQTITDAGNIYAFVCLQPDKEVPWYGMLTRQDWLDQLDLDIPVTINDWYNMLKAYKTLDGVEYPLQYNPNTFWGGMFISAYDIGASFYQDNGTVQFGYIRPEFREWLTELAKWYDEGLLDKDYATRDGKSRDEMIINGKTGAFVNDGWPLYYNALDVAGKGELVAAPYPVMQEGQKLRYRQTDTHVKSSGTVISASCEYPVEAVKWMDFNYSELGFMLFN